MDIMESVKTCFSKYVTFSGRATRSEFWWFMLFCFLGGLVLGLIDGAIFGFGAVGIFALIFQLAVILPSLAVGARRLHDIGRTGWWQLIALIPLIGLLVLIYFYVQKSHEGENQYG